MSEWSWVTAGFAITHGSIIGYFLVLRHRRRRLRRQWEQLR